MKKILSLSLIFFLGATTLFAQKAKEDIKANPLLSGACYHAYPDENLPALTPAPKGYEPFYMNHYGRHGSRWLIQPSQYEYGLEQLQKAKKYGKLTAQGEKELEKVFKLNEASYRRLGELTDVGAEQHQRIAARMYKNFPQIFKGAAKVDAKSTVVIRCILSMENELQTLKALNPQLIITHDASSHDMYFMNNNAKGFDENRKLAWAAYSKFKEGKIHPERFIKQLFSDNQFVKDSIDSEKLMGWFYTVASNMQSHHTDMSFYNLFTNDELYTFWELDNASWYLNDAAAPQAKLTYPFSRKSLLEDIIRTADNAIAEGKNQATLRFGHDTVVVPLAALMQINNVGDQIDDLSKLADSWQTYNIVPMGVNIQLVFYRKIGSKTINPDDVLVKCLYNEREAKLPVKTTMAPYYKWSDLRAFYTSKLATFKD